MHVLGSKIRLERVAQCSKPQVKSEGWTGLEGEDVTICIRAVYWQSGELLAKEDVGTQWETELIQRGYIQPIPF